MHHASAHPDDPHYVTRSGWLRAAVPGANDGVVSVASLIVGVAAADPSPRAIVLAGMAGLTAGAAPILRATLRVVGWGVFAMAVTAGIGRLFGVSV